MTRGFECSSTAKSRKLRKQIISLHFLKISCLYSKLFKCNPQNGRKATTSVRHFVSMSLSTASEVNIVSYLPFLNQPIWRIQAGIH